MHASVLALLSGIIDYAGMFPPAKLPLEEALRIYLNAKKSSPYRWMLGRFVCPTDRLPDVLALAKAHPDASLLSLTVIGQPSPALSEFYLDLGTDVFKIEEFHQSWGMSAVIDTIEVPLPKGGDVDVFVYYLGYAAAHMGEGKLRGFLEIPKSAGWQDDVKKIAQGLGSLYDTWDQGLLGLKLRCGGTTADKFPNDEQVAFFIARCNDAEIPWKATAGLHHPRRHWDANLQVWHHGFLNVFGAGVLAWTNSMAEADLVGILSDSQAQHFRFEEDAMAWKNWSCTTAQIAETRANFATSFGCCSFDEPCADLIAMGLLPSEPEA